MGRPERALDPDADAVQQFADELRRLREKAGRLTYRRLAARAGYSTTALSEAAGGRQFPSLPVTLAYVRACDGDPVEWEARWRAVDGQLAVAARAGTGEEQPPYLGLAVFQPSDAERYFGREALVADLVAAVHERPIVVVLGQSGSGKSSLLRAGLIAQLGTVPGAWVPVLCTPGEHPGSELAVAVAAALDLDPGAITTDPSSGHAPDAGLGPAVRRWLAERPGSSLLLVVDQFEEIFTLCRQPDARERFVRTLSRAAHAGDGRVRVVLGIRADFYGRCAEHPRLLAAMRDASILVGPMTDVELARAVTRPAQRTGIGVDRALVAAVVRDAREPGTLPMVSHVLLETWLHRRGDTLTLAGYHAAGGVQGALARTAERVYSELSGEQRLIARRVLLRLVAFGDGIEDTRRRVTSAELDDDIGAGTAVVLERLVQARLVTRDADVVQLAHEALIRAWPRLGQWLGENRVGLRTHRQLTEAAREWELLGRDPGALYRGSRLATASEWHAAAGPYAGLTATERDFLRASIAATLDERAAATRRTRLLHVLASISTVLLVAALSLTTVTLRERQIGLSNELATQSRLEAGLDTENAMRLALRAYQTHPTEQARGALLSAAGRPTYQARLTGHSGVVKTAAFAPDGRILASAGQDHTIFLWDVLRRTRVATLSGHGGAVRAMAISPDGTLLATADRDGVVILWDLARRAVSRTLTGHRGQLDGIAFSPDGTMLASAGVDRLTIIWDVATGVPRSRLSGYGGANTELAFSPDGRTVATADEDGRVALWDLATGRARVLTASTRSVFALAFSPDGTMLATAGQDQTIALWNPRLGTRAGTLYGHADAIRGLVFLSGGTTLVSAGYDRQAILWDVVRRGRITTLGGHASGLYGVAVSPDGRFIASAGGDGTIVLWDRTRMPLIGHTGWVSAVAFSHDGRLATGGNDTTARIWDVTTHTSQQVITASPFRPGPVAPSTQNPAVEAVAFSPDDRLLATGADDTTIRLWEVATGRELGALNGHTERVTAVVFSPDGRLLASAGGADGTVRLWDVGGRRLLRILESNTADVESVVFSPDGRMLVAAGLDHRISIWESTGWSRGAELPAPSTVERLDISPDGRLLATANTDGTVTIWNLPERTIVATLTGHRSKLLAVAFSPDGTLLASGGLDQEVMLWSVPRYQHWATLRGHTDLVLDLAFTPDSRTLASASGDHTVIPWTTSPAEATARIKADLDAGPD